ncbi:MAG: hypothetical protein KIT69_00390 [Propionibacteriaceae bacterium]|nr:hypothetical protein [Propionibacteriaceae bacterium]
MNASATTSSGSTLLVVAAAIRIARGVVSPEQLFEGAIVALAAALRMFFAGLVQIAVFVVDE